MKFLINCSFNCYSNGSLSTVSQYALILTSNGNSLETDVIEELKRLNFHLPNQRRDHEHGHSVNLKFTAQKI